MIKKIKRIICCGKPPKEKYEKIKKDIKKRTGRITRAVRPVNLLLT
jgi:hypothetical protein